MLHLPKRAAVGLYIGHAAGLFSDTGLLASDRAFGFAQKFLKMFSRQIDCGAGG
jgi:hypothetical protein